ncbi:hypothetical protein VPHF89G2_0251 [Vibrio phage F89 g2]
MKKCRIVKKIYGDGRVSFEIQQKYFLIPLFWVGAWINSSSSEVVSCFSTLDEALANLKYFDGTSSTVVYKEVVHVKN